VATAVFFHAHPDDEAIATGGTMAKMASEGHRVVLVTATRGELGEIPDGLLADGQTLEQIRDSELGAASEILGVARREFLGYRDSGMAGDETNDDPASFWSADVEEASARLAALLEQEGADILTIYDEHGGYGHPDHIQVHRVGARAAEKAGTSAVFMATMNRDAVQDLMQRADELGVEAPEGPDGPDTDSFGEPASRITTAVDVTDFLEAKKSAMRAHASQISESSFFLSMPDEVFGLVWGTEWYIHVGSSDADYSKSLTGSASDG
jgi:LmbE family N-acetylglucosaminyl deacetylase